MSNELMYVAPDFGDPLGLLSACHRRIESQCATLLRLPDHITAHGTDEACRQAASNILKYFNTSGKSHHADEESDVFPLIEAYARAECNTKLQSLIQELRDDHVAMDDAWQDLAFFLEKLTDGRQVWPETLPVARFVTLYRTHMAKEDKHIFSYARDKFTIDQLSELGNKMAMRRNVVIKQR